MTIKEFAKLCKCNTQTLRYYDRINLLKPSKVDPWTGYRQYDEKQALDFVKIKNLQMASFSLGEIELLLTAEPSTVYEAFTAKITEQTAVLQNLKKIQKSYQTEYMNTKKNIEKTKSNVAETMSKYNPQAEFGISDDEYKEIIQDVMEYFDTLGLNANAELCEHDGAEDECEDEYWLDPQHNPEYVCILERHGWENVKDFFADAVTLENGEYLFHFKVNKAEGNYTSFCNTVLGIVLKANQGKKLTLGCEINTAEDNQNHFWLFKRKEA